jgi:hypothetical protein
MAPCKAEHGGPLGPPWVMAYESNATLLQTEARPPIIGWVVGDNTEARQDRTCNINPLVSRSCV